MIYSVKNSNFLSKHVTDNAHVNNEKKVTLPIKSFLSIRVTSTRRRREQVEVDYLLPMEEYPLLSLNPPGKTLKKRKIYIVQYPKRDNQYLKKYI